MPDLIHEARSTLARTPSVLRELFAGATPEALVSPYAPGSFSPYNAVGHLIIGERTDWIPRARIILEHGESRPFDPFGHQSTIEPAEGPPPGELLAEFTRLREDNLAALDAMRLTEADLARTGTHPALGVVTLGQLISTWAAHDLHHTAQVCKGLAAAYRDRVGPWRAYLGILTPPAG